MKINSLLKIEVCCAMLSLMKISKGCIFEVSNLKLGKFMNTI